MTLPHGPLVIDLTSVETHSLEESQLQATLQTVNVNFDHTKATQRKKRKKSSVVEIQDQTQLHVLPSTSPTDSNEPPGLQEHAPKSDVNAEVDRYSTANSTGPGGSPQQFYVDLEPAAAVNFNSPLSPTSISVKDNKTLLLPAHVSVFGTTAIEILPSFSPDPGENDFIQYLDFDDHKGTLRYFDNPATGRTVCKNCKAEGEHKTTDCPVLICLTCGARNEHPTRSCPISKVCYTCGMKGHINTKCPNRFSSSQRRKSLPESHDDCDRCGSYSHKTNECPTLWRLYEYLTEEERAQTISSRRGKKFLKLGEGGEGYISSNEWCYNCGNSGHWGDDCDEISWAGQSTESSAFSSHNVMSGPFYQYSSYGPSSPRQQINYGDDLKDWGQVAPGSVGKQGRKKQRVQLEKEALNQAVDNDPDDWFGHYRRRPTPPPKGAPTAPKKITFAKSSQTTVVPPGPSLLARLGDTYHPSINERDTRDARHLESRSSSYRNQKSHNRDRDRVKEKNQSGSRYRGGYR